MNHQRTLIATLLFILALPLCLVAEAQGTTDKAQRTKWMKEVRNYKYEFFIKEVGLSKEQQEKFFPEYEAMEKEIFAVNKEARDIEKKVSASTTPVSDTEYEAAALAMSKVKQKEGEIENEYFAKFEKILSEKQLFLLKRAENKFTQNILNHHRRAGNK